jgi:hypothetical protein
MNRYMSARARRGFLAFAGEIQETSKDRGLQAFALCGSSAVFSL